MRRSPSLQRRWQALVVALGMAATGAIAVVAAPAASAASIDPSASYVLVNRTSGKALDVYNLATTDGARITQW
ncbi:RICIN domain-containing protein, partial [Cellulomonas fengjieae]